ncbi:MAG TPA: c-type cytochrome [Burkholderiaceae bacterium]|nr:c-type cytochrome [Burkholderiaceae bacterium]
MKRPSLFAVAALMAGLAAGPAAAAETTAFYSIDASITRGARLYENWALESTARAQILPNPAFTTKDVRVEAGDTWRCVTCHGWDYKGNNDFPSIRDRQGGDPAEVVALLKKAPHHLEELLHESDLADLANFVTRGQVDTARLIDSARRLKPGTGNFENTFATTCANCHGLDGGRQRGVPQIGETARKQPAKVLHVVLNGHAGGNMPALRAFGEAMAVGMLAYAQSLPGPNMAASIANGGRLYDDWLGATGNKQAVPHPSYPPKSTYAGVASLTWRCMECHGPDYKGNQGQYATGPHATGIKGIRAMAGTDPDQIIAILRNRTHLFGSVMKYRDLQDLANFVSRGQVDMDTFIDPKTRLARGDAKRGEAFYQTICAGCHGREGRFIAKRFLGNRARQEPWESLHEILNGHPDENMPALRELDQKVVADVLSYVQTLQDRR